ncbi:MAG: hypothetical protein IME94_05460 [Proteobacteria bacterium]|nr:hypothetical protein [Pseudomonadota bacterium]
MAVEIKILGERNTGTNYLEKLVKINIDARILFGAFPRRFNKWPLKYEWLRDAYFNITFSHNLGWKHAMAPSFDELKLSKNNDVVFLTLSKNPYSWLLSMYKRPYHFGKKLRSFDDFLQTPWKTVGRERHSESFANPIVLWNKKNASYTKLSTIAPTINLRYEDVLSEPERIIDTIKSEYNLQRRSKQFVNLENAAKKQDSDRNFDYYRDYYLEERWRSYLSDDQISFINDNLDFKLLEHYNYQKL